MALIPVPRGTIHLFAFLLYYWSTPLNTMLACLFVGSSGVELPAALLPGESQRRLHLCTSLSHMPTPDSAQRCLCVFPHAAKSHYLLGTSILSWYINLKERRTIWNPQNLSSYLRIILRKRPFRLLSPMEGRLDIVPMHCFNKGKVYKYKKDQYVSPSCFL